LFGKPQAYARYLDLEISFKHPRPLLVVMRPEDAENRSS
jgi:hypothetical protein